MVWASRWTVIFAISKFVTRLKKGNGQSVEVLGMDDGSLYGEQLSTT